MMTTYLLLLTMMTTITKISEYLRKGRRERRGRREGMAPWEGGWAEHVCFFWGWGLTVWGEDKVLRIVEDIVSMAIIVCLSFVDISEANLQQFMSDQPIIIEDRFQQPSKGIDTRSKDSQLFFELLDEVETYDSLTREIRHTYEESMMQFARIKFNNPFALPASSHRCIPAFLTLNAKGELQEGYVPFTQTIDDEDDPCEFEEQEEIENECLERSKAFESKGKEEEILYRFNVLNQQSEVISASKKFKELLAQLLNMAKAKQQLDVKLKAMEEGRYK